MNGPDLIRVVQGTPAVHQLLINTRDRTDLSNRERGVALTAIIMTLLVTRGAQPGGHFEAEKTTILALNPGGELYDLAPASGDTVRLYTAEESWGTKSAWGFVTDSPEEKHCRSGTLGASDHDTLALTAILEGLMSVPHGSTVQVFSRNMNADGYMTGRYRARTTGIQALIDDVKTVALQARLNVRYDFLNGRARERHTGLIEAQNLALNTIRGNA